MSFMAMLRASIDFRPYMEIILASSGLPRMAIVSPSLVRPVMRRHALCVAQRVGTFSYI